MPYGSNKNTMLMRYVRSSLIALRFFSTAASVEKAVPTKDVAPKSGGGGRRNTLGRRLIGLVYPKHSAVTTIQKWKEEGRTVRKYELNRVVRELRKLKRYKHALEVYAYFNFELYFQFQLRTIPISKMSYVALI